MWPFARKDVSEPLRDRVADLESAHRRLLAEWSDLQARVVRERYRISKAASRLPEEAPVPASPAPGDEDAAPPPVLLNPITKRPLDAASLRIIARRRGGG